MNHQYHSARHTQRHLQLWIYLLPIVGVVPALWTLYKPQSRPSGDRQTHRELEKVSRQAISLALLWLSSYVLLSFGSTNVSEILSFRLLFLNTVLTSSYFVACTFLMTRLNKKSLPYVKDPNKS